jgi:uncharacterized protein YndB with AHSA1/START domain
MSEKNDTPSSDAKPFVISRTFDAPRELVFDVWTNAAHLEKWFGPKGFSVKSAKIDLRPGGIYHYCMTAPNGSLMWGKWVFRELKRPERIVLINCFSDAQGGITRNPFMPTWPLETLATSTFTETNGKTTVTLEWVPINETEDERNAFNGAHDGMKGGWGGTFDQLKDYLNKIQDSPAR